MSQDRFVAAMGQCDVFLDSIGWSGCNSTLESLAHNLPIVTMPGPLMRARHSLAILAMMGLTGTIASSTDDYIAIAARLGLDVAWRDTLREATARSKHRLYRDGSSIAALEDFLDRVARQGPRALKGSPLHRADASGRSGPKQEPAPAHLASLTLETADVVRPFYFRPKSSDENVIRQVFQQQQYALQHFGR
jgi:glycosyl transferase family 41